MLESRIEVEQDQLAEFCSLNGVRRLSLFGSVLTDRFSDCSDVAPGVAAPLLSRSQRGEGDFEILL